MLLTGTFPRTFDEKQRIAIPKGLREAIGFPDQNSLYLAPGNDGCLAAYTEEGIHTLAQKLAAASPTGQDVRAFNRLFYARAQRSEMDSQGRLRISAELIDLGELEKEVVLVGVGDHLEIWRPSRWKEYTRAIQSQFDEIAEKAFEAK